MKLTICSITFKFSNIHPTSLKDNNLNIPIKFFYFGSFRNISLTINYNFINFWIHVF